MAEEKIIDINEDLKLIQRVNGLTFGSDAFLLSAFTEGGRNKLGADLGSGTGVIPLLCCSRQKAEKIFAVELQENFAELIGRNAALNGMQDRIIPIHSDVKELRSTALGGEVDFVTANPPYMKADSGKANIHDEKFIARHEKCGNILDFCACASRILKFGGRFYCVWRPDRLTDLICAMREASLEPKLITFVCATYDSQPSMVLVRAVKGGRSGNAVTKNLFLHNSREDAKASILSEDAELIYESCSFADFLKN